MNGRLFSASGGRRSKDWLGFEIGDLSPFMPAPNAQSVDRRQRSVGWTDGGARAKPRELRRCYGSLSPTVPSGDRSSVFAFVHARFTDYAASSSFDQPGSLGARRCVPTHRHSRRSPADKSFHYVA
uniref:Uncharacterized protein n=1 Tax=Plectus sambesii TaxID=2011161 RepID=A0A914UW11_9BILA